MDPRSHRVSVAGLDLQVFGGIDVADEHPSVEVIDQDDPRLSAGEGLADPLAVLGLRHPPGQRHVDGVGERLAVGDEHRGGERVVRPG